MLRTLSFLLLLSFGPACTTTREQDAPKATQLDPSDRALKDQLDWVLKVFNEKAGNVAKDDVQAHFHSSFLAQISPDQTVGIFAQLAAQLGTLTVTRTDPPVNPAPGVRTAITHAEARGGKVRIVLSVDTASGLINGLFVQPDQDAAPAKALSFQDAMRQLQDISPDSGLLVAEVKDQTCKPVAAFQADRSLAIGSAFKLYLLYALAEQVRLRKMNWDDALAIREEWKSLPSGTMQLEAAGQQFPVKTFATAMISVSDNTATDHLLYTLGRQTIEDIMQKDFAVPASNRPLLATRELFFLKLNDGEAQKWSGMNQASRRQYLKAHESKNLVFGDPKSWVKPRTIGTIEWFASPRDLCQLLARWRVRKDEPSALTVSREILAMNPGLPQPPGTFRYQGFKGGSEPGVMSLNWLIQRQDKRWFTVHVTANDSKNPLPEDRLTALASGILLSVNDIP